jgi:hypothetical protein
MQIILPGMDGQLNREDYLLKYDGDSLLHAWKQIETNLVKQQQDLAPPTPPVESKRNQKKLTASKSSDNRLSATALNANEAENSGPATSKEAISRSKSTSSSLNKSSHSIIPMPNVVKLINKLPEWHKELNSFALNFNGRVTQASAKNFQMVGSIDCFFL